MDIGNNPPLRQAATEAAKPRERCGNKKSCSCNDYPKRMAEFHKQGPPKAILTLFEMLDHEHALKKKIADEIQDDLGEILGGLMSGYSDTWIKKRILNAMERPR